MPSKVGRMTLSKAGLLLLGISLIGVLPQPSTVDEVSTIGSVSTSFTLAPYDTTSATTEAATQHVIQYDSVPANAFFDCNLACDAAPSGTPSYTVEASTSSGTLTFAFGGTSCPFSLNDAIVFFTSQTVYISVQDQGTSGVTNGNIQCTFDPTPSPTPAPADPSPSPGPCGFVASIYDSFMGWFN